MTEFLWKLVHRRLGSVWMYTDSWREWYASVRTRQLTSLCRSLPPMLLLWGDLDPWMGPSECDEIKNLYPRVSICAPPSWSLSPRRGSRTGEHGFAKVLWMRGFWGSGEILVIENLLVLSILLPEERFTFREMLLDGCCCGPKFRLNMPAQLLLDAFHVFFKMKHIVDILVIYWIEVCCNFAAVFHGEILLFRLLKSWNFCFHAFQHIRVVLIEVVHFWM